MSGSMDYWSIASTVQDELQALAGSGNAAFADLELNDDLGALADALADIEKRLTKLAEQIKPNIPALRGVAKALDALPGVKASS